MLHVRLGARRLSGFVQAITEGVANRRDSKIFPFLDEPLDRSDVARAASPNAYEPDSDAVIGAQDAATAYEWKRRRRGGQGHRLRGGSYKSPTAEGVLAVSSDVQLSHRVRAGDPGWTSWGDLNRR